MLEFFTGGFEFIIDGMESLVFVIAKGFERQGVTESCDVIYVCRAISPAAQYARRSALCPAGIRAFAPGSLTINSQTAKLNVNLLPVTSNEKHKFFRIQVQMINHHNYWR